MLKTKDELATANCVSNFLAALDHPLPQAKLVFELYEVRESDVLDFGVDYLAWKNGPGLDARLRDPRTKELRDRIMEIYRKDISDRADNALLASI